MGVELTMKFAKPDIRERKIPGTRGGQGQIERQIVEEEQQKKPQGKKRLGAAAGAFRD